MSALLPLLLRPAQASRPPAPRLRRTTASCRKTAAGMPGSTARAVRSRSTTFSRTSAPSPTRPIETARGAPRPSHSQGELSGVRLRSDNNTVTAAPRLRTLLERIQRRLAGEEAFTLVELTIVLLII